MQSVFVEDPYINFIKGAAKDEHFASDNVASSNYFL
jgi:hypothetical protein